MGRFKIAHYFQSKKKAQVPRRCFFLELPSHIRSKIYYHAGLVPNQYIDLNYWGRFWKEGDDEGKYHAKSLEVERRHRHSILALSLPIQLLYVCRMVHQEVAKILYGSNYFSISHAGPRCFEFLHNLSDLAVQSLQVLIIRVNECCRGCSPGQHYCYCHNTWIHWERGPLGNSSSWDQSTLEQWKWICDRLAAHAIVHRLNLYVICDCADIETARTVTGSMDVLPILKDCAIRLSIDHKSDLLALTKETVLDLTHEDEESPSPSLSKLMDLPQEIVLNILKWTDLVGPYGYQRWIGGPRLAPQWNGAGIQDCDSMFPPCRDCWKSIPAIEASGSSRRGQCTEVEFLDQVIGVIDGVVTPVALKHSEVPGESPWLGRGMNFCPWTHSAFSINCQCNTSLLSYFLVCQRLRQLAIEAFYSENTFVLVRRRQAAVHSPHVLQWQPGPLDNFLRAIPQYAIKFLRSIIIVFPTVNPDFWQNSPQDWQLGIKMLSEGCSPEQLHLEIYFTDIHSVREGGPGWCFDKLYQIRMFRAYAVISRELQPLAAQGLRCLGIHLSWPPPLDGLQTEKRTLESFLEKVAMGSNYDAERSGKTMTPRFWWETRQGLLGRRYIEENETGALWASAKDIIASISPIDESAT